MKALVLAGGLPQIDLIEKLKKRGITVILADYNEYPIAREYADFFYQVSTLDINGIRELVKRQDIDFLITVCTDQALLTVAQVSEELGLPCYIDYEIARKATNKNYMKEAFAEHDIPTAKYAIIQQQDMERDFEWNYPAIVKPVDCNSSKGVRKVMNAGELKEAFEEAQQLSRTQTVLVEEFLAGTELSIDAYVENGKAILLDITVSEKTSDRNKFIIFRTWHITQIGEGLKSEIMKVTQQIADAFEVKNAPMLIQMLTDGCDVHVIEFSVRTGGGVKHLSIQRQAGVDVIDAVIDLTLGTKPDIQVCKPQWKYMLDEYIYCNPGIYSHAEGFEELKKTGIILDYYIFQRKGAKLREASSSGDRIAGFTIAADSRKELAEKYIEINRLVRIVSEDGEDLMRHELLGDLYEENRFELVEGGENINAS